jgi:hypothetical protein
MYPTHLFKRFMKEKQEISNRKELYKQQLIHSISTRI